jgi:hypothetical protein
MPRKESSLHERFDREDLVKGPSDRRFGFTFSTVFCVIGVVSLWRHGAHAYYWLGAAAAFAVVTILRAPVLRPLNALWLKFGLLLHAVVNPIIMAVMFFGVFLPMGLVMRACGKDSLRLKRNPTATSYWIMRDPPGPAPDSLTHQF